jgi:putative ABC transport system permease protein
MGQRALCPMPFAPCPMLSNYLKIACRNLLRHRSFSVLNLTGLALGMASFWLILQYVRFEESYDRIHADRIYRVESLFSKGGSTTDHWATSSNGYASAMKNHLPEVEDFTRISWRNSNRIVRYQNIKFRENHVCFADSNFFRFFSYPVISGDKRTFLNEPNTVVISETMAAKYFGRANPIGKQLDISTTGDIYKCQVTGVFADLPVNSGMQFDMLMSWRTSPSWTWNFWYQHESYSFVRLSPNTSPEAVEAKFPALSQRYKTAEALRDMTWGVQLVPLADIHLNAGLPNEIEAKGSRLSVRFLWATGIILLLISWINYSNLATVRNLFRAKEMGIRRTIGSSRKQLIVQFLFESLLLHLLALCLAVLLAEAAVSVLPTSLHLTAVPGQIRPLLEFAALFLTGVALTAVYPAVALLRANPMAVLKGKYVFSPADLFLRKSLIVAQFSIAILLIAGTVVVYRQMAFMLEQDPGIRTTQVLSLKLPAKTEQYADRTRHFKEQLRTLAGVHSVSESGAVPGREVGQVLANRPWSAAPSSNKPYEMLTVDYDFGKTFDLQLLSGHYFDRSRPADTQGLILNESAMKQFGFATPEQAIGQKIALETTGNRPNEVIGVIKDYHQRSLRHPFTPIILFMDPDYRWIPTEYYSIRVDTGNPGRLIRAVQQLWDAHFPESSMDYFFLDQFYQQQYEQDAQFRLLFSVFSGLSIFVACLGLLGLSAFTAQQRVREIGIRKVLGASLGSIVVLLSEDFVKLILIAILVASPLAWWCMDQWLAGFAYRISLSTWLFAASGAVVMLVALLTVGSQTLRAARMDPAKSLKTDV